MEIAILILSIVAVCAIVSLIIITFKKQKTTSSVDEDKLWEIADAIQDNILNEVLKKVDNAKEVITESNKTVSEISERHQNRTFDQIMEIKKSNETSIEKLENQVKASISDLKTEEKDALREMNVTIKEHLEKLSQTNEKKLEEMRITVDEKLAETLNSRITAAFKQVTDSLSNVQKGLGEMQELSKQVGGLNKVFNNVKTRGNWGEVSLESLLSQILTEEQFEKQYKIKQTRELVDFVIKMPGKDAKDEVLLPIDAKFPLSDYERLVEYSENGDFEKAQQAQKDLINRIKDEAKSIKEKYINPPKTTDFAIMYLPTEGLYAEIIKVPSLCDELQNKYRIIPCGPTVITALLNSLQVGFTTLKIQKSSVQVVDLMKAFQKDFTKFTELISKVRKNAESVVKSIDEVDSRNQIIIKKLQKVDLIKIDTSSIPSLEGTIIEEDDE